MPTGMSMWICCRIVAWRAGTVDVCGRCGVPAGERREGFSKIEVNGGELTVGLPGADVRRRIPGRETKGPAGTRRDDRRTVRNRWRCR